MPLGVSPSLAILQNSGVIPETKVWSDLFQGVVGIFAFPWNNYNWVSVYLFCGPQALMLCGFNFEEV
jgi:hypothetical protein